MGKRIGFELYQSWRNRGSVGHMSVFSLQSCRWRVGRGLGPGLEGWGGVYV